MAQWFWSDGRLSWGVVGVVVFISVSALAADTAWRLIKVQFDTFLLYAAAVEALAAAVVILAVYLLRTPANSQS